jgi:hypothetical protein
MFGDAQRSSCGAAPNQPQSIRAKIRVWRASMRREGTDRENFFIAKNRDSESAKRLLEHLCWHRAAVVTQRSSISRITKTTTAEVFPAIS